MTTPKAFAQRLMRINLVCGGDLAQDSHACGSCSVQASELSCGTNVPVDLQCRDLVCLEGSAYLETIPG